MGLSQGLFGDGLLLFSYFLWLSFCALPSTELQLRRHLHGWLTFICVFIFSRSVHLIAVFFACFLRSWMFTRTPPSRPIRIFSPARNLSRPSEDYWPDVTCGLLLHCAACIGEKGSAVELRAQSELRVSGCAGQWVPRAWKLNMSTLAAVKRGGGVVRGGGQDGFSRIERERDWDVTAPDYKIICADLPSLWSRYCVCESLMPKEDERTGVIQPIAPVMAYVMFQRQKTRERTKLNWECEIHTTLDCRVCGRILPEKERKNKTLYSTFYFLEHDTWTMFKKKCCFATYTCKMFF